MRKRQLEQAMEVAQKPRFSLRKLNVGVVSVLLGTTIYLASSQVQIAKADTIPDDPESTQVESQTKSASTDQAAISQANTTDQAAGKVDNSDNNVSESTSTDSKKPTNNDSQTGQTGQMTDTVPTKPTDGTDDTNATDDAGSTKPTDTNNSQIVAKKPKVNVKNNLTKTTINGLTGEYDTTTDILTISGTATLTKDEDFDESIRLFGFFNQYGKTVKHLQIKDKIILKNKAASKLFADLNSLQDIKGLENLDTSQVTDMEEMFFNCYSLTSLNLSSFDTKQVTSMFEMFARCKSLTSLDLSSFDTKQVKDMESMFSRCSTFTSLDLSSFDTKQVEDMSNMFGGCKSLTSLDLSRFDTKQVTNMHLMFTDCSALTSLDLSSFDTKQVPDMCFMFTNCSALTSLDLSSFDTKQVTNMSGMFTNCKSLTSLDLSSFDTKQVKDMDAMFYDCSALTSLDLSSFDTKQVKDMSMMFANCESLTSLDLSSFDTKQVKDMSLMFSDCSALTRLDVSSFDTKQVKDMDAMFSDCSALNVLKLGPKTYLQESVYLENPGLWFKQGTKGTLANPEDKQGRTSDELIASYKPDTEADTYIRGYKYQVKFYDKDNNNQALVTKTPVNVLALLNQYPAGTDVNKGLKIKPTAEISTIIKDLESKNYQVVENPFNPEFVPGPEDTEIGIYLTHKTSDQTEENIRKFIVHYQDKNGKTLSSDTLQEKRFTRTKTTDLVTNQEKFTDWTIDNAQTTEVKVPVVKGYVADKTVIPSQTITADKDINITVVYQPVGNFIPVDKNGKPIPGVDKKPYQNDPDDPTKIDPTLPVIDGYTPSTSVTKPTDPTKDTQVTYLENNQTIIGFIDQDENKSIHDTITNSTEIGKPISKPDAIDQILTDLVNKDYEIVNDPFKDQVSATDGKQELNYIFKHKKDSNQSDTVTRKQTIHFVDSKGNKLAEDKITEIDFTRTGVKDLVTGKIIWSDWSKGQTLPEVKVPVVKGYVADKAVIASQSITADKDIDITVTYQPVGNFIPVDKNGKPIPGVNKQPYQNDPDDPTKIKPTLPTIDGYTPSTTTVKPTDPTKDTQVTYLENNQTIIGFIDQDENKSIHDTITSSTEIGKPISKPDAIDAIIADLASKGYEIVKDPFKDPVIATDGKQELNYTFKHKQDNSLTDTVTRKQTIHFVDSKGNKLAEAKTTEVDFTRTGVKDLVTGKITWSDWSKEQTLPEVKVPVVKGYVADKAIVASQVITADKDVDITVTYQPVGNYISVDKNGKPISGVDKKPYENDPDDPTKVKPILPVINGYTPSTDTVKPTNPTKDTQVTYLENNQTIIGFIDQDENKSIHDTITNSTAIGKTIEKPTAINQLIAELTAKGYELIKDPFKDSVIATDGKQELNYIFKHKQDNSLIDTVTRKQTIHFVDSKGNKLADDKVTETNFTRTGAKDLVTGKITWSDWSNEQTLPEVKVPVVKGYVTDKAVIASQSITADKDAEITVTYQPVGNYIPVDKNGQPLPGTNKIPYENDPNDPTKVKAKQKLPDVKGRVTPTPAIPTDPTKDTNVIYETETTSFKVIVHDDTLKQDLKDYLWEDNQAQAGEKVKYDWAKVKKDLLAHGYLITQEPDIPTVYGDKPQTIIIHVKHRIVSLDPDNPPTENGTVNDSGTKWPDPSEYNRVYEQQLHFVDEQGKDLLPVHTQKVRFTRKLQIDASTGAIFNPDAEWIAAEQNYAAVKMPQIAGYEAAVQSKNGIKLVNGMYPSVKAIFADITDQIIYHKTITGGGQHHEQPAAPNQPGSTTTDDMPDEPVEQPATERPDEPVKPIKPIKPEKQPHITPGSTKPHAKPHSAGAQHTAKHQPGSALINGSESLVTMQNGNGQATVKPTIKPTVKSATMSPTVNLPQTGASTTDQQAALELIAIGLTLLSLGVGIKPKKKDE